MIAQAIPSRYYSKILTTTRRLPLLLAVSLFALHPSLSSAELPHATPELANMRSERLAQIDQLVQDGLEQNLMPGCVVTIGRKGKIVFQKAYGYRQLEPEKKPMRTDTVFDMASITKPMATATSVMMLMEQGKIRIRNRVSTYIPEFANNGKEPITVMQLLTHQAGFVPDNAVADYELGREDAFTKIHALKTMYDPGTRFVYSDVGFILLDDLIERQSGKNVHEFSQTHLFGPLGMRETGYIPDDALKQRAVTTEQRDGEWMQGDVHDPRAWLMKGVAGHAGLFSTANDIAIYAQMMLNGGHYDGHRFLSRATVEMMTRPYRIVEGEKVSIRGLGWDKLTGYSSNRAENMSERAFGHGGFTGTVLWIDPELDLFFIFLSNRVHPNGKGSVNHLAGRIATVAVGAIDDDLTPGNAKAATDAVPAEQPTATTRPVQTGIERLQRSGFELLKGQRVGLITNQTGITADGTSAIQLLREAKDVNLVALFSPEHGLAGKLDQSIIGDTVDDGTGIRVFSLYGKTRQPTAEQLDAVDTLVFDIQDIGCRFYTYISTMGLAMQAADAQGKRFMVLDRPNPITGATVAGPMLDAGLESFVGFHSLPVQHGMTVGELAWMFKKELGLESLRLDVVKCENWVRSAYFDETGLPWINPSPNMRNLNQAILYPGIGLWETTNISVGRGTDTPFEITGAPWIEATRFAAELNSHQIPGVQFTPRRFVPTSSKYAGKECGGVQISITNRQLLDPIRLGVTFATTLHSLYPDQWKIDDAMRLLCNQATLEAIKAGKTPDQILAEMDQTLVDFHARRKPFLLY